MNIDSLDDANKIPEVCLSVCPHSAHQLVVEEADVGDGQGQDFLLNRKTIINKRRSKIFLDAIASLQPSTMSTN